MGKHLSIFILLVCYSWALNAQDSVRILSKDDVINIVKNYHPVVKQAELQVRQAQADILTSRGAFDPNIGATFKRKTFDGDFYYSYFNPEFKIPTWYGIDLMAGVEEVLGDRVTQEATLGKTSYVGVSMSVLQGLVFDSRRATLRQAQTYFEMSKAEQRLQVNNILRDAVASYWDWVREYNTYIIYANVVKINQDRLRFVRVEYEQGNRPAIDTVEALTQLQTYQLYESEAWLNFQNAGLELSTYLWLENNMPTRWSTSIVPDSTLLIEAYTNDNVPALEDLLIKAREAHPKLNILDSKIGVLEIERQLKAQNFLPQLDVKANLLSKGYQLPSEISTPFLENNYKLGVDFYMPLFFRKAIGSYKSAKFKVQETVIERDYVNLQVENKVKSYYNEVMALRNQIELYENAYNNFARMYRGELTRFEIGESNLFVVNSRENKLLTARQKLLELRTKWHKSYIGLLWAAGVI